MNRILCLLSGVSLVLLPACYSYAAVPVADAPVGATVRARISAVEADRLGGVLRREDRVLQGDVIGMEPDGLLLEVPNIVDVQGGSVERLKQRVTISEPAILALEVRRLDPWKTAGVAVLAAAVAGYITVQAFDDTGNAPSAGKGGGVNYRISAGSRAW